MRTEMTGINRVATVFITLTHHHPASPLPLMHALVMLCFHSGYIPHSCALVIHSANLYVLSDSSVSHSHAQSFILSTTQVLSH